MTVDRRTWLKTAGLMALAPLPVAAQGTAQAAAETDSVTAADSLAIAETATGKVRGFVRHNIFIFRGIPYGASTAGRQRFLPPAKPAPWSGIRTALSYGGVSPQEPNPHWNKDEVAFVYQWDPGVQSEDCLCLNIWTPELDARKRPVMVWLHGGGFTSGSAHEMKTYDGENLARRGDVVVVSLNHRVGVAGFLNLAAIGGEKYAASANVGLLDIVAALEWVRDNIARFGGDPGNVTVFGQSGGGGKVTALMAMPRAAGLFHRAIVQSGSMIAMPGPAPTVELAAAVVKELGLTKATFDQLHTLPIETIVAAGMAAAKAVFPPLDPARPFDFGRHAELQAWAPTVDGTILPESPFRDYAPAVSASVPLLVGTTQTEFGIGFLWPEFESYSLSELKNDLVKGYGRQTAERLLGALSRAHPSAKPCDLFAIWQSSGARLAAVRQATAKAAQGSAPVYMYLFAWNTPVLGGRIRAYHCAELPFVFANTDRCDQATGGGPEARTLAAKVSDAWIRFARTGNPNHSGLPHWPAFTSEGGATMIFDDACTVRSHLGREELTILSET